MQTSTPVKVIEAIQDSKTIERVAVDDHNQNTLNDYKFTKNHNQIFTDCLKHGKSLVVLALSDVDDVLDDDTFVSPDEFETAKQNHDASYITYITDDSYSDEDGMGDDYVTEMLFQFSKENMQRLKAYLKDVLSHYLNIHHAKDLATYEKSVIGYETSNLTTSIIEVKNTCDSFFKANDGVYEKTYFRLASDFDFKIATWYGDGLNFQLNFNLLSRDSKNMKKSLVVDLDTQTLMDIL